MRTMLVAAALIGCGDNQHAPLVDGGIDAPIDAPSGTLFGEPCMISDPAAINSCHGGAGVCHVEGGEPVCRPWCCYHPGTTCTTGENQCPNFGGECRFEPSVEGGAGGFYFCAPRSN